MNATTFLRWAESTRRRLQGKPRQVAEAPVPWSFLGTDYGGYAVILRQLSAASVVYSVGIGEDLSFDLELIGRVGCRVHAFDPTPKSLAWVARQALPPGLVVHPWGLAARDGTARFAPPPNPDHVSHTLVASQGAAAPSVEVPIRRLDTIMAELGHARLDLLKMDIEGAEYEVLEALVASALRPTQLLVEFHHGMHGIPLSRTEGALEALRGAGYRVFEARDSGREFSLVHGG